jgi:hypothetical protein
MLSSTAGFAGRIVRAWICAIPASGAVAGAFRFILRVLIP